MQHPYKYIKYILILGASAILIKVWTDNRSLFLDELNLALNVAEIGQISGFFQPLDYGQYAPPFFLIFTKALVSLLGLHEMVLRVFPLFSAITCIIFFSRWISRYCLAERYLLVFSLFGFSFLIMQHGTEFKPYALDTCLAVVMMYFSSRAQQLDKRRIILWTLAGAFVVWLSMPSVFILTGVGLYFLSIHYNQSQKLIGILIMIGVWLISFGVYVHELIYDAARSDYLQGYHEAYFMPLPWEKGFSEVSLTFFRAIVGKTTIPLLMSIIAFIYGIVKLLQRDAKTALLYISPIVALMITSMFGFYSILDRLIFFIIPLFIVIMGIGLEGLSGLFKGKSRIPVAVVFLIVVGSALNFRSGLHYIKSEFQLEESRPVLKKMSEQVDGEILVLTHDAAPSYKFYTRYYKNRILIPSKSTIQLDWDNQIDSVCQNLIKNEVKTLWIYDAHTFGPSLDRLQEGIKICGIIELSLDAQSAKALRIRLE